MTLACLGIGITTTRAIAIGEALVLDREQRPILSRRTVSEAHVDAELARLSKAVAAAHRAMKDIRHRIPRGMASGIAEFIDTHLLMLEDAALVDACRQSIREHFYTAEWALQCQRDRLVETFDLMDDPYLKTRRDDIEHVVQQIQGFLLDPSPPEFPATGDLRGRVIVARDLTPAEAIDFHYRGVAAFVSESGGPMSHMAILARSLNIPAVIGVPSATRYLVSGELLIVDGQTGMVLADIDESTLRHYRHHQQLLATRHIERRRLIGEPAVTRDGVAIELQANLELPEDVATARALGASGIGLYRTEFLYMNREDLPDEEEHLAVYTSVIRGLDGIPITIRTLDLGADKQGSAASRAPPTGNPALGLRAIRLCLKEPAIFRPQLRAILRASAVGPVRLMLPMITSMHEVETILFMIAQTKDELQRDGLAFDPEIPIGGMIEIPAAALTAAAIAKRLDFLSIGTNDLIQYTLAIDRLDDAVSYLYDPAHPAVLTLIRQVIDIGNKGLTSVSMCGEMAGDPRFTRLLLGLGLRTFSMQPGSLLEIKEIVRDSDTRRLAEQATELFDRIEDTDPRALIEQMNH
ncbi:phosphoenolpyruvate--protein phosphotransferase [Thioalkalicoccus limnaeus]|uniref:Phosphoenolpyruvate-protein phosphotransferase n=1 Tax=Thioalkalicoccus limnaeus TaxID=120681 RepID=A0ABV4BET8_9GAMM